MVLGGAWEDPRALLNAKELEALEADTQGYSFTGPEAAELESSKALKGRKKRAPPHAAEGTHYKRR